MGHCVFCCICRNLECFLGYHVFQVQKKLTSAVANNNSAENGKCIPPSKKETNETGLTFVIIAWIVCCISFFVQYNWFGVKNVHLEKYDECMNCIAPQLDKPPVCLEGNIVTNANIQRISVELNQHFGQ